MLGVWKKTVLRAFRALPPDGGPPPHSHLHNFAVQLWIALAVAVSVKDLVAPTLHTNYPHFEYGARQWLAGEDMYERCDVGYVILDYRYSPAFAVGMVPLAALPARVGALAFSWLNLAGFYFALRALVRHVLPGRWTPQQQAVFLILVLPASARMFWAVQSNPLVLALVVFGAVAVSNGRWWPAAVLLALAVHIKIWPIAAALLLVACRPRQLAVRLAASVAAVGAVPFLTKPFSVVCFQYHAWYAALMGRMQIRNICHDAWTVWELTPAPISPQGYVVLQWSAALLVLALVLWQHRRGASIARLLTFVLALWAAWQLVVGPGTERNTFGIIAPFTSWGLLTALEEKRGRLWMATAFLLTVVLANGNVERILEPWLPAVLAAHPLGVLMFAVWTVRYARARECTPEADRTTGEPYPTMPTAGICVRCADFRSLKDFGSLSGCS